MKKSELIWFGVGISMILMLSLSEPPQGIELGLWYYVPVYFILLLIIVDGFLSAYFEIHHVLIDFILDLLSNKHRRCKCD